MSTCPFSRSTRKAGFTLIELLAVIGIIAVMASFLMPALSTSMNRAKSAQCKANLRQLMTGIEAYGADNQGYWPPARVKSPDSDEFGNTWHRRADNRNKPLLPGNNANQGLFQYMMGDVRGSNADLRDTWPKGINSYGHIFGTPFACPGSWYATDRPWGGAHSYGMNVVLATLKEPPGENAPPTAADPRYLAKKIELVQTPHVAVVFADGKGAAFGRGAGQPNDTGEGRSLYFSRLRHLNRINLSFVDGHVASMDPLDLPTRGDEGNATKHDFFNFWRGFQL